MKSSFRENLTIAIVGAVVAGLFSVFATGGTDMSVVHNVQPTVQAFGNNAQAISNQSVVMQDNRIVAGKGAIVVTGAQGPVRINSIGSESQFNR